MERNIFTPMDDFNSSLQDRIAIRSIKKDKDNFFVIYEDDGSYLNYHSYRGWQSYKEENLPAEEREFYKFQEIIKGKYPWNYFRIMTNCDGTIKVTIKGKGENTKTIMSAIGNRTDVLKQLGIE